MLIRDLLSYKGAHVEIARPDELVITAVHRMNANHIGALVVVEPGRVVGIITERDLLIRVLGTGCDPQLTKIEAVMTSDVISVHPEDKIAVAMELTTNLRVRHLPVVDDGRLVGLVSAGDLTAWFVRDQRQLIDDLHSFITR
ncbi:MAG TPA: CBS domain-containing protein [Kofleriaceae bacterium]|nr:CBS domain-containing protein [Kofleriaceae bacterium]